MKNYFLFFLLIVTCTFSLSSCGSNTKDWPRLSLPFEAKDVSQIEMTYQNKDVEENRTIIDEYLIDYICDIGFPYKEKLEKSEVTKGWLIKINLVFSVNNNENYELIFYNFGISKGYVDINGEEIHFLPADIESFYNYIVTRVIRGGISQ